MGTVDFSAGALIFDNDGKILLVQEGQKSVYGEWSIPSGGYDAKDETVKEAAQREVFEETGLTVTLSGVIGIYSRDAETQSDNELFLTVYEAVATDGEVRSNFGGEILDAQYFAPNELETLDLRFDIQRMITDYRRNGAFNVPIKHINNYRE